MVLIIERCYMFCVILCICCFNDDDDDDDGGGGGDVCCDVCLASFSVLAYFSLNICKFSDK